LSYPARLRRDHIDGDATHRVEHGLLLRVPAARAFELLEDLHLPFR